MKTTSIAAQVPILLAALLALQPLAAHALSDAEHKRMLKSSPAYAQADAELTQAWKALRAALKRAGLDHQFDGGLKPPHQDSLLASQRNWLNRWRDGEAEELRGNGSEADGYAAATSKRAAYLRGRAEALDAFAALPKPSPDAPLMRLLEARGGSLSFVECAGDEAGEAGQSASAGSADSGASSPASRCAKTRESFFTAIDIEADGDLRVVIVGRPESPMNVGRWKLAADGKMLTVNWENSESRDFTLQDGRYLDWDGDWYVLQE